MSDPTPPQDPNAPPPPAAPAAAEPPPDILPVHEEEDGAYDEAAVREELEDTIEIATERLAEQPDDVAALLFRGEALDDLGESEKARPDLERAVKLAPGSASAQLAWARWLFAADQLDRAREAVDKALDLAASGGVSALDQEVGFDEKARALAHYLKAAILARREALEEAVVELDSALALYPEDPRALLLRGQLRHAAGDLEGSLEDLAAAVAGDPEDAEARLARAEAVLDSGDIAAAFGEVQAAIDLAGDEPAPEMLVVRGEVRLAEGRPEEARADFARAAELAPDEVDPQLGLVDAALVVQDLDAAEKHAREALRLDPEHPQALVFKARVDLARGRAADAEKACSKAIDLDAQAADAFALRSEARRSLGKLSQARHDAATARALGWDVEEPKE